MATGTGRRRAEDGRGSGALDRIDRRILEILATDGRITNQALSEAVGLSARPTLERVRRLEARGIIQGYAALLDPALTGHDVIALAHVFMRDPAAGSHQRAERALAAHPAAVEVSVVSGEPDYLVRFVAPTLAAYEAMVAELLADPALGIARIQTTFVLRTLKRFAGYPPAG
jgi:Lrp/AsnC family leucine-responsive transcriptional regulator